jgi:hypothetical protein
MAAFAVFTSMLETCRQQLDRTALGYGSTDCANAIPRSREGTFDLYRSVTQHVFYNEHFEDGADLYAACD